MKIDFDKKRTGLDYWGSDLFESRSRQENWLGRYMLLNGTIPSPIIVCNGMTHLSFPLGGFKPTQLIEGHMRLAYLRGMINRGYRFIKSNHLVWEMIIGDKLSS